MPERLGSFPTLNDYDQQESPPEVDPAELIKEFEAEWSDIKAAYARWISAPTIFEFPADSIISAWNSLAGLEEALFDVDETFHLRLQITKKYIEELIQEITTKNYFGKLLTDSLMEFQQVYPALKRAEIHWPLLTFDKRQKLYFGCLEYNLHLTCLYLERVEDFWPPCFLLSDENYETYCAELKQLHMDFKSLFTNVATHKAKTSRAATATVLLPLHTKAALVHTPHEESPDLAPSPIK